MLLDDCRTLLYADDLNTKQTILTNKIKLFEIRKDAVSESLEREESAESRLNSG